mgnify:CR=1 FL=1
MANASIEIGGVVFAGTINGPIYGKCVRQETLSVGDTATTMTDAISVADQDHTYQGSIIARLAVDVDSYYAVGDAPDPTKTAFDTRSSARRFLSAGSEVPVAMYLGDKIAVIAA